MLKKILFVIVGLLAALILFACAFYTKAYFSTEARLNTFYQVVPEQIAISSDSATLAYGARLTTAKGCKDCHGNDLGGKIFIDDPMLGVIPGPNLTKGEFGLPADYSTNDWVRALKHGLGRDGKPLVIMPSHEFTQLTQKDMAALISFLQSMPAVNRSLPALRLKPLTYVLMELEKIDLIPAEKIDHQRALVKDIEVGITTEYGKYLSVACQGCHRANMKGGDPIAPGFPPVANISLSGNPGKWTEQEFIATLRTGITPEGKTLLPEQMPWNMTAAYSDVELKALYKYLHTLQ